VVNYAARDSVVYSLRQRRLRLRGEAYVKNQQQTLQAEIIELFFDQSTMRAQGATSPKGRRYGEPTFTDGGEKYLGETITYNFKTKRGTVSMAQTDLGEGYYFGERIKRVSENTIFVQDGCYTTCNKGHPHFYFKSPRMKVIAQDRLFVDQLLVYVEDIPIFYIPFSVFIENKSGRRSGILIPTVDFPSFGAGQFSRGVIVRNLGYYWAMSDYFDTQLTADIFTKGGFLLNNLSRYALNGQFGGEVRLSWGRQRFNTLEDFTENWSVGITHRHTIDPQTGINLSLDYRSPNFNRNTLFDVSSRLQQSIRSSASAYRNFDNGMSVNLSYARDQNIITNQSTDNINLGLNIGQIQPFRNLVPSDSWLANLLSITYNPTVQVNFFRPPDADSARLAEVLRVNPAQVTTATRSLQAQVVAPQSPLTAVVRHNPSIALTLPRIGYFNVNPTIAYRENWYYRRIRERSIDSTNAIVDTFEQGFFREYEYSFAVTVNTTLYGIVRPRVLGINAIRHTVLPSISYSFNPSFARNTDLFGTFRRDTIVERFSRFERDGGGVNQVLQQNINFGIGNNFEAKIADTDSTEQTIQWLNVGLNGSYNMAADSMGLSPIGVNFRTSAGSVTMSGAASFDPYERVVVRRLPEATAPSFYQRVNRLLATTGRGEVLRLSSFNVGLSTEFSSQSFSGAARPTSAAGTSAGQVSASVDSANNAKKGSADNELRERFRQRMDTSFQQSDIFGDSTPGFQPISLPWTLSLSANFNYNEPAVPGGRPLLSAALTANANITIENSWKVQSNIFFDALSGQPPVASITITKEIHCWDFSFSWQPTGFSQGFNLRFGIRAAQLRDIQLRRFSDPRFPQ
jgi:lipopolysaccharide assembly outer membrane protein LptD (OstA)